MTARLTSPPPMHYSWLDLILYLLAIFLLIPLVIQLVESLIEVLC